MRMELVGVTDVRSGTSKETKEPYMSCDLHFSGKSAFVEGTSVAKVRADLLKMKSPPPFLLGGLYNIDISDKGYLREIELLETPKEQKDLK